MQHHMTNNAAPAGEPAAETTETPTRGCYAAADYLIDFETRDGVSNGFKESLENFPSEADAVAALARHINNATGAAIMLDALKDALEDINGPVTHQGIKIRFRTLDKVRAAIARAEGGQS